MRTVGLLLALIGGLIAYLGYKGKMGDAFKAVMTGSAPTPASPPTDSNNQPAGPPNIKDLPNQAPDTGRALA